MQTRPGVEWCINGSQPLACLLTNSRTGLVGRCGSFRYLSIPSSSFFLLLWCDVRFVVVGVRRPPARPEKDLTACCMMLPRTTTAGVERESNSK